MAKEEKEKKGGEGEKKSKSPKKHLHAIHTEQAHDGTLVHHHVYKKNKEDAGTEQMRMNAATSQNADEAGQHVAEQFAQNEGQQGGSEPEEQPAGGTPEPAAGIPA